MQQFYIAQDGQAIGPVTLDEAELMATDGRITLSTLVYDEATDWRPIAEHPELACVFARAPGSAHAGGPRFTISEEMIEGVSAGTSPVDEERLGQLQESIDRYRVELATAEARLEAADARVAELAAAAAAAEENLETLRRESGGVERLREAAARERETVAREREAAARDRERVILELADAEEARAGADEAVNAAAAELAAKRREIEELRAGFMRETALLEERMSSQRAECERIETARREAEEAEKAAGTRVAELRAKEAELSRQAQARAEELILARQAMDALAPLRAELDLVRTERDAAAGDLMKAQDEIDALVVRRAAYDAEMRLIADRLAGIREETADLEEKRLEAQAMLGREVATAFEDIRRTIGDLGTLTGEWTAARAGDEDARRQGLAAARELLGVLAEREKALDEALARTGESAAAESARAAAETAAEAARLQATKFEDQLKSLTTLCWQETERLEAVRVDRDNARAELLAAEEQHLALENERRNADADLVRARSEAARAEEQRRAAEAGMALVAREREQSEQAIVELNRMRAAAMDAYLQLERDLAQASLLSAEAARREGEAKERAGVLEREVVRRQAELREIEELTTAANADKDEAHEAAAKARAERDAVQADSDRLLAERVGELNELRLGAEIQRAELVRIQSDADAARLQATTAREDLRVHEERKRQVEAELGRQDERRADLERAIIERQATLAGLGAEIATAMERGRREASELDKLGEKRSTLEAEEQQLRSRIAGLDQEMVLLERERAARARADLVDLRALLKAREDQEKGHLEQLLQEARSEFLSLQDDWATEEKQGITNDELRKIRQEVEERRRELAKAERQVSAMRAGLAKLREENGRNLLRRIQSFESQQLEDLRRRLMESRSEAEALEKDWGSETKSAELIDRQVIEVKAAFENH